MTPDPALPGWGLTARLFHWGMAALVLFQAWLGVRAAFFTPDLGARFDLVQRHKSWGTLILALALARLAWRLARGRPPGHGPVWRRRLAAGVHATLYVLLLALPLSGWVMVSAAPLQDLLGMRNMVFGLFALPDPWVPGSERVEALAATAHLWAAVVLAAALALHVAGALWGQFGARDHALRRMILGR